MCPMALAADEFCDVYVGQEKVFTVSNTKLLSAIERGQLINDTIKSVIDDQTVADRLFELFELDTTHSKILTFLDNFRNLSVKN